MESKRLVKVPWSVENIKERHRQGRERLTVTCSDGILMYSNQALLVLPQRIPERGLLISLCPDVTSATPTTPKSAPLSADLIREPQIPLQALCAHALRSFHLPPSNLELALGAGSLVLEASVRAVVGF